MIKYLKIKATEPLLEKGVKTSDMMPYEHYALTLKVPKSRQQNLYLQKF